MTELLEHISSLRGIQAVYVVAMGLGIVLPLINLALGGIAAVFHIDFDWDFDGLPMMDFIPLRPMCILSFMLVFGGVGLVMYENYIWYTGALFGILLGYIVAVILNKCLLVPMRKAESKAIKYIELVGKLAKVTVTIDPSKFGEVQISTGTGLMSLIAKTEEGVLESVKAGKSVRILRFDTENKTVIVAENEE